MWYDRVNSKQYHHLKWLIVVVEQLSKWTHMFSLSLSINPSEQQKAHKSNESWTFQKWQILYLSFLACVSAQHVSSWMMPPTMTLVVSYNIKAMRLYKMSPCSMSSYLWVVVRSISPSVARWDADNYFQVPGGSACLLLQCVTFQCKDSWNNHDVIKLSSIGEMWQLCGW